MWIEKYRPTYAPDDGGGSAPPSAPAGSSGTSSTPSSAPSGAAPSATPAVSSPPVSSPPVARPEAPPAAGVAPSTPDPLEPADDIFAGFDTPDEDFLPEAAPVVEAAPTVQPEAPAAPAAPAAAAPEAQPPQQPAQPTGQQGQPSPLPSHAEPAKIADTLLQNRGAIIDHLAATQFSLSKEDAEALETDAVGFIPKIMARVFVEAQAAAMRQMQQVIPAMQERMSEATKRHEASVNKFYARWPEINRQNEPLVLRMARTYRQMNPNSTLDQMIEDLGPMVMIAAKIQPGVHTNGAAPQVQPLVTPQPRRQPPSPFQPAGAGPSGPSPVPAADPWAGLGGDYGED